MILSSAFLCSCAAGVLDYKYLQAKLWLINILLFL